MANNPLAGGFAGGTELGNAHGSITVDTGSLQQAGQQARNVGRQIEQSFEGVDRSARKAEQAIGGVARSMEQLGSSVRDAIPFGRMGAHGLPIIDMEAVDAARRGVTGLAQDVKATANEVDRSVKQSRSSLEQFTQGIRGVRTELLALGAIGGLTTRMGLGDARDVRNFNIAFRQFVGTQAEAARVMESLTRRANEFGLEVEGVWQLGRSLLPVLRGNTEELDKWVTRAALLRSTFPIAQRGAETRAISEFLAGQEMSLQRLFNVPPALIQEAKAQFKDYGDQLDFILQRMGATEEGARNMGDSFVSLRNELKESMAVGFEPLFNFLQAASRGFVEWSSNLRQTNPELLQLGAGLTGFVAVGAPTLLLVNQLVEAFIKLRNVRGARLGLAAAAVPVTFGAAVGIANLAGAATGNREFQDMGLAEGWVKFKAGLFDLILVVNRGTVALQGALTSLGNAIRSGAATILSAMAQLSRTVGMAGQAQLFDRQAAAFLEVNARQTAAQAGSEAAGQQMLQRLAQGLGLNWQPGMGIGTAHRPMLGPAPAPAGTVQPVQFGGQSMSIEQADAIQQWADSVQRIERAAATARIDATHQYEQQRTQAIAQYELTIAREAEDFARQRLRQQQALLRQIGDIEDEARRRAAKWAEDLAERIGDLTSDTNKRIADAQADTNKRIGEIERDYHHNRERAERDHRDRLMDAAARLDAVGVFNEMRNFKRQKDDADQAHRERIAKEQEQLAERTRKEQESLQERIAQEQRSHAKRLAEAKEADDRRIADLRQNFARQRAEEDEDRAIRLARMAEDHQRQLGQMAAAHAERMAQIDRHAAEERRALDEAFVKQMASLGMVISTAWQTLQEEIQRQALKMFEQFKEDMEKLWDQPRNIGLPPGPQTAPQFPVNPFRGFADGGPVMRTGIAKVHAGEFVLSRQMLAAINSATAGRVGQSAMAMGGPSLTLAPGAIVVNAAAGQSEELIGQVVVNKLAAHYRQMGAQ